MEMDLLFDDLLDQEQRPAQGRSAPAAKRPSARGQGSAQAARRPAGQGRRSPPVGAGWYGPQEPLWHIPHPFLRGQPYTLELSKVRRVEESNDRDQCFITIDGIREPLLVGVSVRWMLDRAPWAAKGAAKEAKEAEKAEEAVPEADPGAEEVSDHAV